MLRETAPDLADRLDQLSATFTAVSGQPRPEGLDRDQLFRQIRELPGLADLFRAPDIVPVPGNLAGPVVVINLSEQRSDALIITSAGIDAVRLRDLDVQSAASHAGRLRRAVQDLQQAGRSAQRAAETDLNGCLRRVLDWLADTTVTPVLDHLADQNPALPRLWWSPTGALANLPLHAAAGSRLETTVMSYTPTLRALAAARARQHVSGPVLVVDAADDLRSAAREVAAVLGHHPNAFVLSGPEATHQAVTAAMPSSAMIHVCAHGVADPSRPSLGYLELDDRDLTIDEISRLALPRTWLTYLSACSTAQGSELLPDESLNMAAAFGVAGLPSRRGEPLACRGRRCRGRRRTVDDSLADGQAPAAALQLATFRLRMIYPDRPALWTPFVHVGP